MQQVHLSFLEILHHFQLFIVLLSLVQNFIIMKTFISVSLFTIFSILSSIMADHHSHHDNTKNNDIMIPVHEKKILDMLSKKRTILHDHDVEDIIKLHHENATFELYLNSQVRKGTFDQVLLPLFTLVDHAMIQLKPITHTDEKNPNYGIFSFEFVQYMRTKKGCEAIFSGFGTMKFDDMGLIVEQTRYSNDAESLIDCFYEMDMKFDMRNEL
jgi:hypothetical protein